MFDDIRSFVEFVKTEPWSALIVGLVAVVIWFLMSFFSTMAEVLAKKLVSPSTSRDQNLNHTVEVAQEESDEFSSVVHPEDEKPTERLAPENFGSKEQVRTSSNYLNVFFKTSRKNLHNFKFVSVMAIISLGMAIVAASKETDWFLVTYCKLVEKAGIGSSYCEYFEGIGGF